MNSPKHVAIIMDGNGRWGLKNKEVSEDDVKKNEKIIQDLTDSNIKQIDEKVISKEKEIMTI